MARQYSTLGQLVPQLIEHRKTLAARPWVPLWSTFPDYNASQFVLHTLPDLEVHRERIENKPTAADPLGMRPGFEITWAAERMGEYLIQCSVYGRASPQLPPEVMQVWLCVEYPDTFRVAVSNDG